MMIPMTRGSTSREILALEWDHPVADQFKDGQNNSGTTSAAKVRAALPVADAFELIAKDDPRPLLVLRECVRCKGTEHALFTRRLNNEKTMLLLQWFHCVKLPPGVLDPKNPFHQLFVRKGSKHSPHLFIARPDGSMIQDFDGSQTQSKLQKALTAMIGETYKKNPKKALKAMLRYMSQFDMLDLREKELVTMMDKAREEHGPKSSKTKKVQRELEKVRKQKALAMKRAKAVCDLKLKVVKKDEKESKKAG